MRRRIDGGSGPFRKNYQLTAAPHFFAGFIKTGFNFDKFVEGDLRNYSTGSPADVKARFLERQTQANNYKRRVDVIDGLRVSQNGPVNLLAMLGETVNNTEAVWLNKMDDSGPSVNLEGFALSTGAVANLIANLQKTGYFRNVEIKETFQDEQIKDMQAFQFTLTCEKGKS